MTQLGRHIDVQHFTFELGTFFGRNLDVFDRCRKCIHDPTAQLIFDIFFILLDYVMFQGVFCTIGFPVHFTFELVTILDVIWPPM